MKHLWLLVLFCAWATALPTLSHAGIDQRKLGARYNVDNSNIGFRVYSSSATRIEVYVYASAMDSQEVAHIPLTRNRATDVWQTNLRVNTLLNKLGPSGTVYYGYRAWGPNWPYVKTWVKGSALGFVSDVDAQGNRFNPNKLLLDPYALEISHDPNNPASNDGTLFATGAQFRLIDSGAKAPKGIVLKPEQANIGTKPERARKDDVIYEVHLRGLTKNDPSIPTPLQGTYAGAALKATALASLGINTVEFLPLQETQNDSNDLPPNSTVNANYWGYMTLNYFAPDRRYAADRSPGGPTREFKQMVKAFHDQGIKVYVDVVYNHTGEGGAWNGNDANVFNLYSWRGLDNPTYYTLTADRQFNYDNTGVGGNYNTFNPVAQNLIVDSLAYWSNVLGVDGFRFDLAAVLGNTCTQGCFNFDKLNPGTALNRLVREFPPRPASGGLGLDLIAEPWAIGGNSFQQGGFPLGWSEWNGDFRDTLRKSQNLLGIANINPGQLANYFSGSAELFEHNGRPPWNSINFMVAHDGFTLKDLYTCNSANNRQQWPFGPSDGGSQTNLSWDQGGTAKAQRQAARNGMAFLMLAAGVPMMTGGDELLRSLNCNNNPYNLDSTGNWLNYAITPEQTVFTEYVRRLIALRKKHAALRPIAFYTGSDTNANGMPQLSWFTPAGITADANYFNDAAQHALAYRLDGTEFNDSASAIYIAYNADFSTTQFTLPWPGQGKQWFRLADTAAWNEGQFNIATPGAEAFIGNEGSNYGVNGRSVIVLIAR